VYITISREPGGQVAVHAVGNDDLPENTADVHSAPMCTPDQVDRTTGAIQAMHLVVDVEQALAAAVAALHAESGLAGPVAGVLVHPGIGRLLAVGPFDSPPHLDRWWHWHGNRLVRTGIICLPVALQAHVDHPGR
jgi:hypothetical protein